MSRNVIGGLCVVWLQLGKVLAMVWTSTSRSWVRPFGVNNDEPISTLASIMAVADCALPCILVSVILVDRRMYTAYRHVAVLVVIASMCFAPTMLPIRSVVLQHLPWLCEFTRIQSKLCCCKLDGHLKNLSRLGVGFWMEFGFLLQRG